MRKNKDYEDIENILSEKANKLESGTVYSGAMRDSQNEKRVKREKEQKGSYGFPVRQLVAAALTMVLVCAGTFGALKFLEYKGAQRLAQQGAAGEADASQSEQIANDPDTDNNRSIADETVKIEPVEYDPSNGYGEGYVFVLSGDKVYQPFICESSVMAVIDYEAPVFEYCGKLDIVNNVKDRNWTVLDADIWFPEIVSYNRTFDGLSIDQICEIIDNGLSDSFRVYLKVTWDDPDDENAVIYYVDFVIRKTAESAVFEDVTKFEIEYTRNGDALELDIPVEHRTSYVLEAKCEAANAAGYRIFFYDAAPIEFSSIHLGACVYDENDGFMFEFMDGTQLVDVKDIWYAEKTPSGHPTMFYMTSHTESGCYWTYADIYAYDLTTKEKYLVTSVGPEPFRSQSHLTVFGELSYENENMIVRLYEDLNTDIWNPDDKNTWPEPFAVEPIKWNSEKYVVESIYSIRSLTGSENETETEPETDDKEFIEQLEAEAEGRLYVVSGDTEVYPALISAVISGEDGQKRIETGNDMTEIEYAEPFEIRNGIRTLMYVDKIDVTVADMDSDIEALKMFLHAVYEDIFSEQLIPVRISVHWNDDNIYEYGFLLRMIPYNKPDTQTETVQETTETVETSAETVEEPDVPVDHTAQVAELQSWLSQCMWYGMTTDDLVRGVGSLTDNGISFKTRFLADDHSQLNVKEGYTFVAYRSEHYDIIFSPKNEEPHVLLEARVIMRRGAEFDLPFGLTLDMSPEEALHALGYTDEQITAMDGYSFAANYELRYNDRFLRVSYQCNGADVGIELGSDPQMYIETAE